MSDEAQEPHWYILHTYTGYEMMVRDNLFRMVENNNLQDQIFDVKIPMEKTIEEKNGKKKVVEKKTLPCYVFIKMLYSNELWYLITNTRGITGFVGPQGRAKAMTEQEIRRLHLETLPIDTTYVVGDSVNIESGPLEGFDGEITEINTTAQKAKVRITMFGNPTEVEVELVQISKKTDL